MEDTDKFAMVAWLVAASGFEDAAAKLMMLCKRTYHGEELLDVTLQTRIKGRTRVHVACSSGNLARLHELLHTTSPAGVPCLRRGVAAALEIVDVLSRTPAVLAVIGGHGNVVDALISAGADPLSVYRGFRGQSHTPLGDAARRADRAGGYGIFARLLNAAEQRVAAGLYGMDIVSVLRTHLVVALRDACIKTPPETGAEGREGQLQCISTLLGRLSELGALDGICVAIVAASGLADPLEMVLGHANPLVTLDEDLPPPVGHVESALSAAAKQPDRTCLSLLLTRYQALVASAATDEGGVAFTQEAFDRELRHAIEAVCEKRPRDTQLVDAKLAAVDTLFCSMGDCSRLYDPEEHHENWPNALHLSARWSVELTQLLLARLDGFAELGFLLTHEAVDEHEGGAPWSRLSPLGVAVQYSSPAANLLLDATSTVLGLEGAADGAAETATEVLIALCERFIADPPRPCIEDADFTNAQQRDEAAIAIAKRLVAVGAQPAAAGTSGTSSLVAAALAGDVPLLEYFFTLLTPQQVAAVDDTSRTVLGAAASRGYAQCVRRILAFLRESLPADQVRRLLALAFAECVSTMLRESDFHDDEWELNYAAELFRPVDPAASEDKLRCWFHSYIIILSDIEIRLRGEQWMLRCRRGVATLAKGGLTAEDVEQEPSHRDAVSALASVLSLLASKGKPNATHLLAATLKPVTTEAEHSAYLATAARAALTAAAELTPADATKARDLGRTVNALARRVTGGAAALSIDGAPAVDATRIVDPAVRAAFEQGKAA